MRLPSTFDAEFGPLRGAEISALANAKDNQIQDAMVGVLRGTWIKTIDPGPYTHADGDLTPQFDKFLSGDIWYAFLACAVESVPNGEKFSFQVQCPRRHSDRLYQATINLRTDLLDPPKPVADGEEAPAHVALKTLSAETVVHLREHGNRFDDEIAGRRVVYKLQSNADTKLVRELLKLYPKLKTFTPTELCAIQAVEIDGLKSNAIRDRYQFFCEQRSPDVYALHARMVSKDCGIDTAIRTACGVCGWEQEVDLPFDGMYSPRK